MYVRSHITARTASSIAACFLAGITRRLYDEGPLDTDRSAVVIGDGECDGVGPRLGGVDPAVLQPNTRVGLRGAHGGLHW